ncbi:MAG: protein kinase [Planctomycetes bacterium]|nr:protein kinase [Planctomycetota bacterium]
MSDSGSSSDLLNDLAHEFAERCRRGEHPAVTEYTDKYPELAAEIRDLFPALAVMEELGSADGPPTGPYPGASQGDARVPERMGEYRILREVARGGMGIVYEAVQESLGRHVALKVLPSQRLTHPTHLERFRREAKAVARLHHTNIVPVFGVGEHEGVHYYAMQFINGQGLDSVLKEVKKLRSGGNVAAVSDDPPEEILSASIARSLVHGFPGPAAEPACGASFQLAGSPGKLKTCPTGVELPSRTSSGSASTATVPADRSKLSGSADVPYFRSVAQLGLQVAEALAHAHQQGVLHRDIKPSNLLLDTQGTVWITDFGLAKAEGMEDLTSPGDIVGTLRYMAPERFQGQCDPRSDVYSLGLTLYELLTLRPAFAASERAQLIDRLLHDRPPRPRALDARIPRDLETIVLKALAREPGERYPTATALAEDLRCFLTDRPIQARRTPLWERTWRLCKRNRLVASLTALLVTFLLVATGVSIVAALHFDRLAQQETQTARQEAEERRKADKARKEAVDNFNEAEKQRRRAVASEAKARAVVREYLVKVTESQLLTVPGLQPLRRELLTSALRFYEDYLKEHEDDPTLKAEIAATQLLVGRIYNDLGQGRECRRACQQAQLLYEALLQADPENPEFQHGLGQCHYWGASDYAKAVEIWEKAVAARPAHAEYQRSLATAYNSLAIGERQKPAESLRLHQKALVIREKLVQNDPDSLENRNDLGATLNNIGVLLADKGQYQEALAMCRRAAGHEEVAYAKAPQMILYGRFLGTSYSNIANMSWRLGQRDEALEWKRKSVTVFRSLVGDNPAVPQLRSQLWGAYTGLARYQQERGKLSEAALSARLARDVIGRLPRNTPDDFYWLARVHALCAALVGEGKTELTAEEKAERKREADLAVKALQQALAAGLKYVSWLKNQDDFEILHQRPDFKDLVSRMEEAVKADRLAQAAKGKEDAKLKAQQEALAIRQKLAGADPTNTQAQVDLAANLHAVGVLQAELGQTEEASKSLAQALGIRQTLNKKSPQNTRFQADLAATQIALGNLDWKAERYAEGARWWDKGLALFDAALHEEPQSATLVSQSSYYERAIGARYAEIGLWEEAAQHYRKAFDREPFDSQFHHYAAVLLLAGDATNYQRHSAQMLERFGNTDNLQTLAELALSCNLTSRRIGDSARLVQMAEKVLAGEPKAKAPWSNRNLGLAYYRAGRFKEALRCISESPEDVASWPIPAMAYHRLGQADKAREWFAKHGGWLQKTAADALAQTALQVPTSHWVYWAVPQILYREAKELIEGKPAPDDPWLRLLRGRAYAKVGKSDKAEIQFQAAVAAAPKDAQVWLARGKVFAQLGQHDRAEADFAKVLELKPDDPQLWIERGRYFAERGQHQKADAHFAKAAKLTPDELNRFLEAGWWVVGPYPRDLKIVCPPEIDPDPARPVATFSPFPALPIGSPVAGLSTLGGLVVPQFNWVPCKPEGHGLMIHRGHPALDKNFENVSLYAVTYVYSPDERQVTLHVGGDDHMRLWLNGRLVHETNKILGDEAALDRVSVMLKPGRNTLLVKVNNYQSGFYFRVRLADNPRDRGFAAAEVGLWDEAAKAFGKAIERQKEDANLHRLYAQFLLGSGDVDGYRRQCKHMLDQFGSTTDPGVAWSLEAACSLSPTGITDPTRLVQLADIWLKAGLKESWRMFHVGMAHYRAGKFAEAVPYLEGTANVHLARPVLAMAHHRLGHTDEARRWLAKAEGRYNSWIQDALAATPPTFGPDDVWGLTPWREAKELIEGKPPPADPRLRLLRAKGFVQLGQLKKAEAEFQAAIELRPENASLWIARGRFYAERGDHKKADLDFAKAATLTPDELNKFLEGGWWVAGPYAGDLKTSYPLEKEPDPSKPAAALAAPGGTGSGTRAWQFAPTGAPYGGVNLGTTFGSSAHVSAYALTYITSPDERSAMLRVGGGDGVRLWLNGRLVHEMTQENGWWVGLDRVPVTLRAGRNTLLAKVSNRSGRSPHLYLDVRLGDSPLDRGLAFAEMGLWQESAPHFIKAFEKSVDEEGYFTAPVLVLSGRVEAHRRLCAELLARFGDAASPDAALHVVIACSLAPEGDKDTARLLELAKRAQRPELPAERWRLFLVGLAHYRAGQFEQAIRFFEDYADTPSSVRCMAVLAMAHHRLGHAEEARKFFKRADESFKAATEDALAAPRFKMPHSMWWEWAWTELFHREARAVIQGGSVKEDAKQAALAARARQELNRRDKATAACDHALMLQPDQPRLWLARGRRYAELKRWKEAEADLAKAAKLKPDDPQVWAERGRLYAEHGQPDKAAADFARALDLVPPPKFWWEDRSSFELDLGRRDDVIAQLARLRPTDKWVWIARLKHLAIVRDWKGAAQAAARWTGLEPDDAWGWYTLSILRWGAGDLPGYRQVCREMVTRFGEAKDAGVAHLTVKACLLLPDAVSDLKPVLRLAERAELPGWFATTSGMADYRAGNYTGALKRLRQAIVPVDDYPAREALNHLFLAMAHHQLGHADEATRALAQARAVEGRVKPQRVERPDLDEIEWLRVEIVRREAEALILKQAPGFGK